MPIQTAVIDYVRFYTVESTAMSYRKSGVLVHHIAPLESWGTTEERAVELKYCNGHFLQCAPETYCFGTASCENALVPMAFFITTGLTI